DYLERARDTIAATISRPNLSKPWTWMFYGIASLMFEQDMDAVNEYLATSFELQTTAAGESLQSATLVRLYDLFNDRSPSLIGRLTAAAQQNLQQQMWKLAAGYSKLAAAEEP